MASVARYYISVQTLSHLVRRRLSVCLRSEGITSAQYTVLSMLGDREPQTAGELAIAAHMTAQSMGEHIRILEVNGWVERSGDPDNLYALHVCRSAKGRSHSKRCDSIVKADEASFLAALSPQEAEVLHGAIERLNDVARKRSLGGPACTARREITSEMETSRRSTLPDGPMRLITRAGP